jgi:PIN domain nuclease of toxin-antitoxin system
MGRPVLILLDTNVVLWMAFDADRLSKKARETIEEARRAARGLAISDMTLLELAMLASKKRIRLDVTVESFLSKVETSFSVLPMSAQICSCAFALPRKHFKDPADRIIVGTALAEGLALMTADREIRNSGIVPTIW